MNILNKESWLPHVGSAFVVIATEVDNVALDLIDVSVFERHPGDFREGYSLVFAGPKEPFFQQSLFRIEHPDLGELEVFLVPIGPEAGKMRYEAVFN